MIVMANLIFRAHKKSNQVMISDVAHSAFDTDELLRLLTVGCRSAHHSAALHLLPVPLVLHPRRNMEKYLPLPLNEIFCITPILFLRSQVSLCSITQQRQYSSIELFQTFCSQITMMMTIVRLFSTSSSSIVGSEF